MSDKPGFEAFGRFYPFISLPDWRNGDVTLARQITRVSLEELDNDRLLSQIAFFAVAVAQAQPELSLDEVVKIVQGMKPSDVNPVGFEKETEKDPNSSGGSGETPSASETSSSAASAASSEQTPETSPADSSGTPG